MKPRSPTANSPLEHLLRAILNNNPRRVASLLKTHPTLATTALQSPRLYQSKIVHQLYAKDSALHLAAAGHRALIVQLLLNAGADPNCAQNHRRSRPLHYAADGLQSPDFHAPSQVKTLRILLRAGADLHAPDKNGATALHRAVRTRSAAAVKFLLHAGADPIAKNLSGATPFHLAVQNTGRGGTGNPTAKSAQHQIIHSFLAHGLSPTLPDAHGKSVLDWTHQRIPPTTPHRPARGVGVPPITNRGQRAAAAVLANEQFSRFGVLAGQIDRQ